MDQECSSVLAAFVVSSENKALLFEIRNFLVSASLESSKGIISFLKSVLKSRTQSFTSKTAALKIVQAGLDTLNFNFVYEVSSELSARLKRIALDYNQSRGDAETEEFFTFLLFCLQDWAMKFGELAEETTIFNQVYFELLDKRITLPHYEREKIDFYLKDLIDLKAAMFLNRADLTRKFYERVKRSKRQLETEMLSKAGQGLDLNKLINVDDKYHETILMYKEFRKNHVEVQETVEAASSVRMQKCTETEDPEPKCTPFVLRESDSLIIAEETYEIGSPTRDLDDVDFEQSFNGELSGLKLDYCRLRDLLDCKESEINEIAQSSEEQLQRLLVKHSELRKRSKKITGQNTQLRNSLSEANERIEELTVGQEALKTKRLQDKHTIQLLTKENAQYQTDLEILTTVKVNEKIKFSETIELLEAELSTLTNDFSNISSDNELLKQENSKLKSERMFSAKTAHLRAVLRKVSTPVLPMSCNLSLSRSSIEEDNRLSKSSAHADDSPEESKDNPPPFILTVPKEDSTEFEDLVYPTVLPTTTQEEISNLPFWKSSLTKTLSILYENSDIQVGIQMTPKSNFWMMHMSIRNKSIKNIENLTTKLICPYNELVMKINAEAEEAPVLPNTGVQRSVAFQFKQSIAHWPVMRVNYNSSEYFLLLPITRVLEYRIGRVSENKPKFTLNVYELSEGITSAEDVAKAINFYGIFHKDTGEDGSVTLECAEMRLEVAYSRQNTLITVTTDRETDKDLISSLILSVLSSNTS